MFIAGSKSLIFCETSMTAMIVEYIATRFGGHDLVHSEEFREIVCSLSDQRVKSLKEKSESHEIFRELMAREGWKAQIRVGGVVARRVDFYKRHVEEAVESIASTPVWISSTMTKLANIKKGTKALYLILSLSEMRCSFESALEEIDNVVRVLVTNRPIVILGCRCLLESDSGP